MATVTNELRREINSLVESQVEDVFNKMCERHPEITSGDFPPDLTFELGQMQERIEAMVRFWYEANTGEP